MKWSAAFCISIMAAVALSFGIVGNTYELQRSIKKNDAVIAGLQNEIEAKRTININLRENLAYVKQVRDWETKSFLRDSSIVSVKLLIKNKTDSCYYINSKSYHPKYMIFIKPQTADTTKRFFFSRSNSFRIRTIRIIQSRL